MSNKKSNKKLALILTAFTIFIIILAIAIPLFVSQQVLNGEQPELEAAIALVTVTAEAQATLDAQATAAQATVEAQMTATAMAHLPDEGIVESPDTPTPAETPMLAGTPTETSTLTEIPIVTDTPAATPALTETLTPTPTSTPSPLISTTDAIVAAEGGLNLRSGPGTDYASIGILETGQPLTVIGGPTDNGWIKVLVEEQNKEGWINASSTYVTSNINLAGIPTAVIPPTPKQEASVSAISEPNATPTPRRQYGPKLLHPPRWASVSTDEIVEFSWEPSGIPLEPDEYYSILVLRDGLDTEDACIHTQTQETKISLPLKGDHYECEPGDYYWGVGIAKKIYIDENKFIWQDESLFDEKNPLGIGQLHSGTPPGGSGSRTGTLTPSPP